MDILSDVAYWSHTIHKTMTSKITLKRKRAIRCGMDSSSCDFTLHSQHLKVKREGLTKQRIYILKHALHLLQESSHHCPINDTMVG